VTEMRAGTAFDIFGYFDDILAIPRNGFWSGA
jgi:hypothetical protein